MSAFDRILESVKDVLRMNDDVQRLAEGVKDLAIEVRDHDRRLVRIETLIEVSQAQAGPRHIPGRSED